MTDAKQSDWNTKPLPVQRAILTLDHTYTSAEMEKIRQGYLPAQMEDKWFIYWQNDCLHFHRSWTGICLYVMPIAASDDHFVVRQAEVNRDTKQYSATDDQHDAAMVLYLVELLLLERFDTEFPTTQSNEMEKTMESWQMVGRAMLGDMPGDQPQIEDHPQFTESDEEDKRE